MSNTRIKFKIQCSFRTSFLDYSHDNFFSKTTKDGHIVHKQGSCSHAKNQNLLKSLKPFIFKKDTQIRKLHRKLNFPNIFDWLLFIPGPWPLSFNGKINLFNFSHFKIERVMLVQYFYIALITYFRCHSSLSSVFFFHQKLLHCLDTMQFLSAVQNMIASRILPRKKKSRFVLNYSVFK